MVLLEVAMYIKDIQEEECETAIKVNFIDPQNGKAAEGEDPSNIKQHETILTACWKYPEEQHQSFEFTKCPSVHECWCILSKEICMHIARGLLQICERIQNGGFISCCCSCLGS